MKAFKMFQSEAGSTLIQILLGLAIMSMVGFSAAHITVDTKRVEIQGDTTNSISQIHLMAIQKSRNLTLLKKALSDAGLPLDIDSATTRCLSGAGVNCQIYNSNNYVPIPGLSDSVPSPGGKTIDNSVQFKLICVNSATCDTLLLRVSTALSDNQIQRTTDLRFPGTSLVDRAALSFACVGSADNVVTGIDFQTRQALCQGIPIQKDCADGEPVVDLDAGSDPKCATMANLDCANGMKNVGLVDNQGTCL